MAWNEKEFYNRRREIYAVLCGFTSDYLFEIFKAYSRMNDIENSTVTASDISRSKLLDLVFRMVKITAISNEAGTEFWILPGGGYIISLNDLYNG